MLRYFTMTCMGRDRIGRACRQQAIDIVRRLNLEAQYKSITGALRAEVAERRRLSKALWGLFIVETYVLIQPAPHHTPQPILRYCGPVLLTHLGTPVDSPTSTCSLRRYPRQESLTSLISTRSRVPTSMETSTCWADRLKIPHARFPLQLAYLATYALCPNCSTKS